jgi:hypothetical protein
MRLHCRVSVWLALAAVAMSWGCDPCFGKTGDDKAKCEDDTDSMEPTGSAQTPAGSTQAADSPSDCITIANLANGEQSAELKSAESVCYKVSAGASGQATFSLVDTNEHIPFMLFFESDVTVLQESTAFANNYPGYAASKSKPIVLERGEYFVKVSALIGPVSTPFTLITSFEPIPVAEPATDPGDQPRSAQDIENGSGVGGYVGPLDEEDVFHFSVDVERSVAITLSDYGDLPWVTVVKDANSNGIIDSGEESAQRYEASFSESLAAGEYYLKVASRGEATTYTLTVTQ